MRRPCRNDLTTRRGTHGWTLRRGRPQSEVSEKLLEHRGLLEEGDDPHGARTARTHQGINFRDFCG
ncbi:MAG: hypothetical protein A2Z31_04000 [candidate division NC10 bacterium RBG_16_65_8]|nr:MAG: hypothetical protein A2Z31_04000 [candidate division NC10 bacterium RBG_16_65_8]